MRKALEFAIFTPLVFHSGDNSSAYEKMAPCETEFVGSRVVFPHPNPRFQHEIVTEGCYTSKGGFDIRADRVIVDIGANVGIFTILAALTAKKARVICLEPEQRNYQFLCDNLSANSITNAEPARLAMAREEGITSLHVRNRGSGSILNKNDTRSNSTVQLVQTVSMSSMMLRYAIDKIDMLKMDIEGAEFQVFEKDDWLNGTRKLAIEVHPDSGDPGIIIQKLKRRGFEVRVTPAYARGLLYLYAHLPD